MLSVPLEDDDRALVTVVPHTTSTRGSRLEVPSHVSFLKKGAFDVQNLVTIPLAKLERSIGRLPADQLGEVERAVRSWLGLS